MNKVTVLACLWQLKGGRKSSRIDAGNIYISDNRVAMQLAQEQLSIKCGCKCRETGLKSHILRSLCHRLFVKDLLGIFHDFTRLLTSL